MTDKYSNFSETQLHESTESRRLSSLQHTNAETNFYIWRCVRYDHRSYALQFLGLFALDISSDWLQMYRYVRHTFRKQNKSEGHVRLGWLLSAYYKYRTFMGFCAVGSEAIKLAYQEQSILFFIGLIAAPGFAIKQWINVVQMKANPDITIEYDIIRDNMKVETE